ncbi:hypothetical protein H257_14897 [Aphanomyces astaci]|uniref:Derlin n=1 Tax=Aphanomyces astaci TaxID=112090 RepID=W4FR20_APHAT|nr:hypothetical protein H257_14897 [Aphanomyces astaci]ETV69259.1 hypothetical protein H257_14897 [Aphanomyces astaci]|eukprot:XP_009841116.1 hypothetical protein H257_14897 [Aphanomyces astaci]
MNDPLEWYYEIPIISRLYLTGAFLTTVACALELISPFSLYFNFNLIFYRGQVWRLVTNFLFFGLFSLDFIFHMYFLVRYSRMLEEGSFRGRTADFLYMLLLGALTMILVAPFVSVHFLGSSLTFMMVYVWGRRNEHTRLSFLGLFPFTAPYLPWVLLLFSMVLGNSATIDLIGIVVGHIYYFFEGLCVASSFEMLMPCVDVYPAIADIRGWRVRRILETPTFVKFLCNPHAFTAAAAPIVNDIPVAEHAEFHPHAD